mgnify:CR=1 FL=1
MDIKIEYLKEEHLPFIEEIDNTCPHKPWSSVNELKKELENPIASYFVAVVDGKPVGYGGYWWVMFEAEITNIATHKDYRKMGIATKIIEKMVEKCAETSTSLLHLEVRESNESAINLYKKMGFVQDGFRKNYYNNKEHAILMTKEIEID